jgi:hypothetical protein
MKQSFGVMEEQLEFPQKSLQEAEYTLLHRVQKGIVLHRKASRLTLMFLKEYWNRVEKLIGDLSCSLKETSQFIMFK